MPPLRLSVATKLTCLSVQVGIDDHDGHAGLDGALHGLDEGAGISRGEDDAADVAAGEILDDLDLLVAVVLAQRALPEDLGLDALGVEFLLGFGGSAMDGLPEFVRVVPLGMTAMV